MPDITLEQFGHEVTAFLDANATRKSDEEKAFVWGEDEDEVSLFEEVDREFQFLVQQMTDDELRSYLKESLFMSFNRFENERLMTILRRADSATEGEG